MAASVVVKVGTTSITHAGELCDRRLSRLRDQLLGAAAGGTRPVLVSSGAIAAGRAALASPGATGLADLQGLAAIGQGLLMSRYAQLFGERGRLVAQLLLTGHDFGDRTAYLNARRTLDRLLRWGVVPIVNENDTTATDEISLGENDRLAALVATLIAADLLIILTDIPGVFSADPRLDAQAGLIDEVSSVDAELEAAAGPARGVGSGGMASKVAAARIASWSGIPCVIAGAEEPDVMARALAGEPVGTRIRARSRRLGARKVWIAFARPSRGRLVIDSGAVAALCAGGRSLLPVGIVEVRGDFALGDAVEILDDQGRLVAKGLASCSSRLLAAAAGVPGEALPPDFPGEAVHRNDLVVLSPG